MVPGKDVGVARGAVMEVGIVGVGAAAGLYVKMSARPQEPTRILIRKHVGIEERKRPRGVRTGYAQ